jgi:hypothetical protein
MEHNVAQVPQQLRRFATPALMAGESLEDYETLRQLLIANVSPQSTIEWLWLFDLAELSWEILRYRKLKGRALEIYRVKAVEALLFQLDGAGISGAPNWMNSQANAAVKRHPVRGRMSTLRQRKNITAWWAAVCRWAQKPPRSDT